MATTDSSASTGAQRMNLSAELEADSSTAAPPGSESQETPESGASTTHDAAPDASASEGPTTGNTDSDGTQPDSPPSASSDAQTAAAGPSEALEPQASPYDSAATSSPEDQEWLTDASASAPPAAVSQFQGTVLDARGIPLEPSWNARSLADSPLDARAIPLEASWNARSLAGTVMDTRTAREVKGKGVESWQLEDTVLDTRAVREVKGRLLEAQDQRFKGTILDSRAERTNTQSPLQAQNLVRRFNPQQLLNPTPPTTGRFFVLLGPVPDFAFLECSGLSFSLETEPYAEGGAGWNQNFPAQVEYARLVFTRGLVIGPGWIQLRRWRESMLGDGPPLRMNGVIVLQNDLGVPICFWRFKNGYPVQWTGPTLQPGSMDLAVEVLEIAHEGLKVIDIALAGDQLSSSAVGMASVMSSDAGSSSFSDGMSMAQSAMTGDGSALGRLL